MQATDTHKHVLIVDRTLAAVEPLRQILCEAGFVARAITDGSAAIASFTARPPHLVIVDWKMAGLALLKWLRSCAGCGNRMQSD